MSALESTPLRWPQVMVDIETLGTGEDAAILEIGAVWFDLVAGTTGPRFEAQLLLSDNEAEGRRIDAATLAWWMERWRREQSPVPNLEYPGRYPLRAALLEFSRVWGIHSEGNAELWCRGNLDVKVLEHAFRPVCECPWTFYQWRDQRTVTSWEGVPKRAAGLAHTALSDALMQVEDLFFAARRRQAAHEVLKERGPILEVVAVAHFSDGTSREYRRQPMQLEVPV
jgi:hypothetical protein